MDKSLYHSKVNPVEYSSLKASLPASRGYQSAGLKHRRRPLKLCGFSDLGTYYLVVNLEICPAFRQLASQDHVAFEFHS